MLSLRRRIAAILAGSLLAATIGVGAAAANDVSTFTFYGCNPPAPSEFMATKDLTNGVHGISAASSFHIEGSTSNFVVLGFSELGHGHLQSGNATVACQVNTNFGTFTFYGFITPAS